jgi:hypothetical protein
MSSKVSVYYNHQTGTHAYYEPATEHGPRWRDKWEDGKLDNVFCVDGPDIDLTIDPNTIEGKALVACFSALDMATKGEPVVRVVSEPAGERTNHNECRRCGTVNPEWATVSNLPEKTICVPCVKAIREAGGTYAAKGVEVNKPQAVALDDEDGWRPAHIQGGKVVWSGCPYDDKDTALQVAVDNL